MIKVIDAIKKGTGLFLSLMFSVLTILSPVARCYGDDTEDSTGSILFNYDFENNTDDWKPFDHVTLTYDQDKYHSGEKSLKASKRSWPFCGPSLDITEYVAFGNRYSISLWLYYDGKVIDSPVITLKYTYEDGTDEFKNIDTVKSAEPQKWHNMKGDFYLPEKVKSVLLYVESGKPDNTIWIDDVVLSCTGTNIVLSQDISEETTPLNPDGTTTISFENSSDNWRSCRNSSLIRSDTTSVSGTHSMYVCEREDCRDGIAYDISALHRDRPYKCTAHIAFFDKFTETETFVMQLEYYLDGILYNIQTETRAINRSSWSVIGNSGSFRIPEGAENVYITIATSVPPDENNYTHVSFYIDDIVISDFSEADKHQKNAKILKLLTAAAAVLVISAAVLAVIRKTRQTALAILSAQTDEMTGVLNRNAYEEIIEDFIKHPEKCKSYYYAVCDLNGLKHINDEFGHNTGDAYIKNCADVLLSVFRGTDGHVYRTGGDEFICISKKDFRKELSEALEKAHDKDSNLTFSVAVGFGSYDKMKDGSNPDIRNIIARCDQEMYKSKTQKE